MSRSLISGADTYSPSDRTRRGRPAGFQARMTGRLAGAATGCAALALLGLLPGWASQAAAAAVTGVTASSGSTVTINGPAVPLQVTRAGQTAKVTFKGKFGQSVSEVLTGLKTTDDGCADLNVIEPGGATLDSGRVCGNGTPMGVGPDNLPVSGTYTVELTIDTTAKGGGTLWVSAPVTIGTVKVNGPMEPLKVTRCGQGVARTFTGKAGQSVSEFFTGAGHQRQRLRRPVPHRTRGRNP